MKFLLVFMLLFLSVLNAKGVRAGTIIKNQATIDFSLVGGASFSLKSNEVKNVVSQVLNPILLWQDSEDVDIYEGAKDKVLKLSLRNDGNGKDDLKFSLKEDSSLSSFVESMGIYIDTNQNGYFDEEDNLVKSIKLEPDEKRDIFLVSSLKKSVLTSQKKLNVEVDAVSKLGGSGIKGKVHKNRGENGVDAIDGINGGVAKRDVYYSLKSCMPYITKEVKYYKKQRYYLVSLYINFDGNGRVGTVHIEDRVPRGLSYQKGSIRVNERYQSDKKDNDLASFDFNINRLSVDVKTLDVPKRMLVTYILKRRRR